MSSKRLRAVTFQRRVDSSTSCHCCVPMCAASARFNSALSFHTFPKDTALQRRWVSNIRRDNFTITNQTRVCSRHFQSTDVIEPHNTGARRRLKCGAVPALFEWNGFSALDPQLRVWSNPDTVAIVNRDHDYCSTAEPAGLSHSENDTGEKTRRLEQIGQMAVGNKFGLERFSASDENIRFYTRFATHAHLMAFWRHIEPDIYKLVREGAQAVDGANAVPHTTTGMSLPLIDEFFLFMTYLSLGLTQEDLAHMFGITQSTVSPTINTWANFLYSVLGVVGIWLPEAELKKQLPHVFNNYSDTQVVLACVEMHCQTPNSLFRKSEVFPTYKSHCSFKGLIGVAPHGAVTFVSALHDSSISDEELLKQSGIVSLLKPTMAIMVEKGFHVEHCVPCKVYIPALLSERPQPSVQKVRNTQSVARLRVHIKGLIQRVKEQKIFSTVIPLSLSCCINQLYTVTCLLLNYQSCLLSKCRASKRKS